MPEVTLLFSADEFIRMAARNGRRTRLSGLSVPFERLSKVIEFDASWAHELIFQHFDAI